MIFKRREKLSWLGRLRELIWPRAGWRRTARYVFHRLHRIPGSPYNIAAGFACGAAISFTPFLGLHFTLAALIAWLIGGNLLASAIGTAVGNPWSFPFIWLWAYHFGAWILGLDPETALPKDLSIAFIFENPVRILLPMSVGGVPTSLVAWFAFFWPLRRTIEGYQRHRARLRRAGRRRRLTNFHTKGETSQ